MSVIVKERPALIRKKKEVQDLIKLIDKHSIIGLVQMENMGLKQLQGIKKKLKGLAVIKMAKNNLIKRAISNSGKPGLEKLSDYIKGSTALIFSELNGFKLTQFLKSNKSKAFAKPGSIAQNDIIIPSGNTGFQPGPMITELNEMGLKTKIVSGSIWIAENTVVAKTGEEISRKLATLLSRLNIQPMTVGLELVAVYDNGSIYEKIDLDINVNEVMSQFNQAYNQAYNLSVNVAYPTKENIIQLLTKSQMEAINLAKNAAIMIPETIGDMLLKAQVEANSIYKIVKDKDPNI